MAKISFVVPAYNEGKNIRSNLTRYVRAFSALGADFELIFVDDGSTDDTFEEASKVGSDKLRIFRYEQNHGKGHALKIGASKATGDFITFIDSDSDLPPEQVNVFLETLDGSDADIVIGSKRHPKSLVRYPLKRRILSFCYHLFVRMLFRLKLTDTQTGLKLLRREVAQQILPKLLVKRYAFDVEFLAVASRFGHKIREAPVIINYGAFGSWVGLKAIWHIFVDTCAVFYRLNVLKYYDRPSEELSPLQRNEALLK